MHEVTIRNGVRVERHLCERCAGAEGAPPQAHSAVSAVISQIIAGQAQGPAASPAQQPKACPTCGMSYSAFRSEGVLGCPDCYHAFEPSLGPLIERAHEGATHHVGKVPGRLRSSAARVPAKGGADVGADRGVAEAAQRRAEALRRALSEAVAAEQYERAARLRDELRGLEGEARGGAGAGGTGGTGGTGGHG